MTAFKGTLSDLGRFCDRNTETCKVGKSLLSLLWERARYGAKAAYEYLGNILSDKNMAQFKDISPNVDEKPPQKKNHPILP